MDIKDEAICGTVLYGFSFGATGSGGTFSFFKFTFDGRTVFIRV
jgi:hypothetical protein